MVFFPDARAMPAPSAPRLRIREPRATGGAILATLAIMAGPLLADAATAATMYKWVDRNGRVVYSDQAPPPDVKAEIVKPPPPPANSNAAQELADKELEIKLRDKKRAEEAQTADRTRAEADRRREHCMQARGQLRTLQLANQEFYYRYNDKGERIPLDDAARKALIEQLQQIVRDSCQA